MQKKTKKVETGVFYLIQILKNNIKANDNKLRILRRRESYIISEHKKILTNHCQMKPEKNSTLCAIEYLIQFHALYQDKMFET